MGAQKFLIRGGPLDCIKNNSSNDRAQVKPKITITVVKGQAELKNTPLHVVTTQIERTISFRAKN